MTRKLHNTLMAIIASSSLLVVGLIAGAPVIPELGASGTSNILASVAEDAEILPDNIEQPDALPSRQARAPRDGRQSLAMPFYSFAPRG